MKQRLHSKPLVLLFYTGLLAIALSLMYWIGRRGRQIGGCTLPPDCVERDYDRIAQEKVLNMLTTFDGENYRIEGDSITGFVYEISKAISRRSGWQVNIRLAGSWQESLRALCQGEIDVIAIPVAQTSEIDTIRYRYLDPISFGQLYLVRLRGRNPADRLGSGIDSVVLPRHSSATIVLRHLADETGDSIRIVEDEHYGVEQLAIQVAEGHIAATVCNEQEAQRLSRLLPEINCKTPISVGLRQGWVLRRSSPQLADSLDVWLSELPKKQSNI